jgi:hypothetical protein
MSLAENVEIVIARYNENLAWTLLPPFNQFHYTVYNKGDDEQFEKSRVKKIVKLHNVGRNDHTYLYHIVTNYDSLMPITVFLPGSTNLLYKMVRAKKILNNIIISEYTSAFFAGYRTKNLKRQFSRFSISRYVASDKQNSQKNGESVLSLCKLRPYWKWYTFFFNNLVSNCYTYGGVFSIDRRDVLGHPVEHYEKLMNTVSTHSNPEAGHYIERSWGAIFHPLEYTKFIGERIDVVPPNKLFRQMLIRFNI